MQIIILISLIVIGFVAGKSAERRHYKRIEKREKIFHNFPIINFHKNVTSDLKIKESKLVTGSVVVSLDYFKRIVAILINIVGGKVVSYESLLNRGRREAILRMQEDAKGYDIITNVKIQTSSIGSNANQNYSIGSIEILVYGTAIKKAK